MPGLGHWAYLPAVLVGLAFFSRRAVALARAGSPLAIEMLIALLVVHLAKGYAASGGGYEYVLLIGAACFLIAIRGGGPYSVDRMIGKEL